MSVPSTQPGQKKDIQLPLVLFGAAFAALFFLFSLMTIFVSTQHSYKLTTINGVSITNNVTLAIILLAFLALYCVFYFFGTRYVQDQKGLRLALVFFGIFVFILLISLPFLSSDLYGYTLRAIITNEHRINPYTVSPADLGYDSMVIWSDQVMRYGPLYTFMSLGLNSIVGSNLAINLIAFRIVNVLMLCAVIYLVYKILERRVPNYKYVGTALFCWNPFVLLEVVHSGHNDIFILFTVILGLYLILRKRFAWSIIVFGIGSLIKFGPIILITIPIILIVLHKQTWLKKVIQLVLPVCVILVLAFLLYLPFGGFRDNIVNLTDSFYAQDYLTLPKALVFGATSLMDPDGPSTSLLHNGYIVAFALIFGSVLLYRFRKTGDITIKRTFWILLFFLSLLSMKFNIWYLLWLFPLVLLVKSRAYHHIILFLTFFGLIYYSVFGIFLASVFFFCGLLFYGIVLYSKKWFNNDKKKIISNTL